MMSFSRVAPFALRSTRRPPRIPLLTTVPLQASILMMKRSVSSQDNQSDPKFSTQPHATGNIPKKQSEEQDPVSKEKAICEELLQRHFSSANRFRLVVDKYQPDIFHHSADGTQVQLPASHVVLTRIEDQNAVDADGKGKLHALYLYVHDDPSEMLVSRLADIVRGKDEAGELTTPKAAFAILQAGMEIMFFEYGTPRGSGKAELRSLGGRPGGS